MKRLLSEKYYFCFTAVIACVYIPFWFVRWPTSFFPYCLYHLRGRSCFCYIARCLQVDQPFTTPVKHFFGTVHLPFYHYLYAVITPMQVFACTQLRAAKKKKRQCL